MVIERQSIVPEHFEDRRVSDKPVWIRRNNRKPDALSIACILDEFSFSSYAPEANFFQLSMDDWKQELESCQPSLLFVESAWRGHNGSWWNQVQRCGPELRSIVEWCNARSIPTAFWNKEDPVHFATFIDTASLFDVVFTTDVDCIPRYRATLNHDNVHFLPFAAQPLYHNPLEEFQRVEGCSFAGAFYKKYGDRNRDFSELVPAIKNQGTFDIYDRNFGTDDETQQFPLEFRENIVGHLMPEDIEVAYKGYTHSLNLNSVKQSQSMFARRVFELLASNTAVISNYSRGLQLLFGDLTIATDGANQLTERLRKISLEPNGRDRIRQAGVRKVFREHTYRHRLHQILTRTGIPSILDRSKDVLLLSVVQSKLDAQRVINSFHRQNYEALNLLLVCDGFTIHGIHKPNISVATDIEAARSMIESLTFNYLGFLDPDSWYGAEYVGDIMDVFSWAGVSRVGHAERYKWDGQGVKRFDEGTAWTIQPAIPLTRSLISTSAEKFLSRYDLDPSDQNHALAVSTLEFCEKGAFATKDALRYVDTPEIDTGLVLNEIQEYGHSLDPALEVLASQPTNLQSPAEILGEENASKYIKYATNELGELEITSTLPEEKHQYIYNRHLLSPFMLPDKQGDEVYLGSTPGLDVMLALVFLDSNKKRVGHTTLYTGRNNVLTWPEETAHIQTGLRVRGSGKTTLKTYSKITAGNSVPLLNLLGDQNSTKAVSYEANKFGELEITSTLPEEKHQYIYNRHLLSPFMLPDKQGDEVYLGSTPGLDVMLTLVFLDIDKKRLGHTTLFSGRNNVLTWPEETAHIQTGLRVRGSGKTTLKTYSKSKRLSAAHPPLLRNRSLLITNQYPSYDSLYKNAFIASRLDRYQQYGFKTVVFCMREDSFELTYREFDGVEVLSGTAEMLSEIIENTQVDQLLIHFLSPEMWSALKDTSMPGGVSVWIHGYEAQPWWRREVLYETPAARTRAASESDRRMSFWHEVLSTVPKNWHFIFVSDWLANTFFQDVGLSLPSTQYSVVHNIVDTDRFPFQEKKPEQRFKVLSIRPFASKIYANDLSVAAVLELEKTSPEFSSFEFSFFGDGRLFDETMQPIMHLPNVKIHRGFLTQNEIAEVHSEHGVFLVPSRMDTQGVSRGEAMSSGMVPVTTDVAAIPEFVDTESGIIVPPEDPIAIAAALQDLADNPELFLSLSQGASSRVSRQLSQSETIQRELSIVNRVPNA